MSEVKGKINSDSRGSQDLKLLCNTTHLISLAQVAAGSPSSTPELAQRSPVVRGRTPEMVVRSLHHS